MSIFPAGDSAEAEIYWAPRLSLVAPRIYVSGELQGWGDEAIRHLGGWVAAGIRTYVDLREYDDLDFIAEHSPHIRCHRLGVHDDGATKDHAWFETGSRIVNAALEEERGNVLIGCAMGVSRSTSMAFAVLMSRGYSPIDALNAIFEARPVATFTYAIDALNWWHEREGVSAGAAARTKADVVRWLAAATENPYWIAAHEKGEFK